MEHNRKLLEDEMSRFEAEIAGQLHSGFVALPPPRNAIPTPPQFVSTSFPIMPPPQPQNFLPPPNSFAPPHPPPDAAVTPLFLPPQVRPTHAHSIELANTISIPVFQQIPSLSENLRPPNFNNNSAAFLPPNLSQSEISVTSSSQFSSSSLADSTSLRPSQSGTFISAPACISQSGQSASSANHNEEVNNDDGDDIMQKLLAIEAEFKQEKNKVETAKSLKSSATKKQPELSSFSRLAGFTSSSSSSSATTAAGDKMAAVGGGNDATPAATSTASELVVPGPSVMPSCGGSKSGSGGVGGFGAAGPLGMSGAGPMIATPVDLQSVNTATSSCHSSSGFGGGIGGAGLAHSLKKSKNQERKTQRLGLRTAAGQIWEDKSMLEWDPHDFRMFCGDLGNEVSDDSLARVFNRYPSFKKAKVVRDKKSGKTKGFGFVSFSDPADFTRAMREMNGKYVGNRPIKLKKSDWKSRNLDNHQKRMKLMKKMGITE